jgi:hypothetical protein
VPETTDSGTLCGDPTQPYPPIFTGEFPAQPDPVQPLAAEREPLEVPAALVPPPAATEAPEPATGPLPPLVQPEIVPGSRQYLKRWSFVLVVAGVWIVGAACGLGLYHWWFHSLSKTPSVFVLLVFLIVCTVGGLVAAMLSNKPLVSALAVGLMSAPLAATIAAAVLYGLYFCDRVSRCLVGLIPY